jgi:hypothetical protein
VKGLRRTLLLLLPLSLGGCQMFGALSQSVGSVLATAISLALVAAPFVLSYYLYKRGH